MWSWGDIPKQLQSFEDFSILFRCGGGCLPPHLTWSPITFGSNGTFAPNAFGKSSVENRSPIAVIGPIERRRADELLSLRGCTTPPGPGLAPKVRGWAGLKDSRQCAGRWCGGGAHGSDRCSKLRGAAQPEQTNTPSIGRPSVCRPGRRPAANDSPSQRNGPQDLFREKVQRLS